jgi:hypothetical protein
MIKVQHTVLLVCLLMGALTAPAQITLHFDGSKKSAYLPGENQTLQIQMVCQHETCLSGMKQSKIFASGLEIAQQSAWQQKSPGIFTKQLTVRFLETKKPTAKLTIMRKVDKDDLFRQEVFNLKKGQ